MRWRGRLLWLIPLLAGIAYMTWAAITLSIPDWARWTLGGIAIAAVAALVIAVLIGPAARRLAGERRPLTPDECQAMTATERAEAVNAARNTLMQAATGLVVIGGVVFTGQGLLYTAQSLDASRQAQRTAEQGQITDRYTKAVEQLGSGKLDVRLGGLYALERLAQDSPRDHQTVYDVLTAFIREHDPKPGVKKLPGQPATDVQAALTIVGRRNIRLDAHKPDLNGIRTPHADLRGVNLRGVNLTYADLTGADLADADLADAELGAADLTGADLYGVDLTDAVLDLADLREANLRDTQLRDTHLINADLTGADLTGADLMGADLRQADLRKARGVTESEIRKGAVVDETTKF
jgi:Pentapeptide repeats (8 copies)